MKAAVPILRFFDEPAMRAFYIDFLGFEVGFEHRFHADAPLYLSVHRGACELHLSQHFGDGTPGTFVRIEMADVASYCTVLNAKNYKNARPGIQQQTWGWDEMSISDPSANKLIFCTAQAS